MEKGMEQNLMPRVADDEMEIDLKELFLELVHRWKVIFLAMLIGAAIFGVYHVFLLQPSYQADASIYITNTDSMITFSDLQLSAALTEDYSKIINSRTVLNRVIQELELDLDYKGLRRLIEVENPNSTHIIEIRVTCGDLELSRNIANALLNVSVENIYQIVGSSEPTIIDFSEAEAVEEVTPSLFKYLVIGAALGAFLVCAVLLLRALTDTTMKSEEDVDKYMGLPVLTAVPYFTSRRKHS